MDLFETIYCAVLLVLFFVVGSIFWNEKRAGISPSPTMPAVRNAVIGLIDRHGGHPDSLRIAEFGCGWGGLVGKLARAFPISKITGYEISPCPLFVSRLLHGLPKRIRITGKDFFEADWSGYDVIVCYLSPQHMIRIKAKLDGMVVKPLLVTCSFPLPDSTPLETIKIRSLVEVPVMAYKSVAQTIKI